MIILSGGTGTPKLIKGLRMLLPDSEITVIVNTAEDIFVSGNLVSPDLDTILYLFSGMLDETKWWGVKNDTFHTHKILKKLGIEEKLIIGDTDRGFHIYRSEMMRRGASLTDATLQLSLKLGIKAKILPMCNEKVDTMIVTSKGVMHFQDFWVGMRGEPEVVDVILEGIEKAKPTEEVLKAMEDEDYVIIGPSNPITSILPIIALKGIKEMLKKKKVVAVSPIIGKAPVSGPAGKFMKAKGLPVSWKGVMQCYKDFLDIMVIDCRDKKDKNDSQIKTVRYDTMMNSVEKSKALASFILEVLASL